MAAKAGALKSEAEPDETYPDIRGSAACSFCLKPAADVERLVAGPGVHICNECVELAAAVIKTVAAEQPVASRWDQEMSDEALLAHLPRVSALSVQVERQLAAWVGTARARGITWTRIGLALGMTRQSAWERFAGTGHAGLLPPGQPDA
ncbi:MAG TPA: ClpX C4-type zinc finger protein [Streptosporangiaceae bacterium]|jgi:hypothetical protein